MGLILTEIYYTLFCRLHLDVAISCWEEAYLSCVSHAALCIVLVGMLSLLHCMFFCRKKSISICDDLKSKAGIVSITCMFFFLLQDGQIVARLYPLAFIALYVVSSPAVNCSNCTVILLMQISLLHLLPNYRTL